MTDLAAWLVGQKALHVFIVTGSTADERTDSQLTGFVNILALAQDNVDRTMLVLGVHRLIAQIGVLM